MLKSALQSIRLQSIFIWATGSRSLTKTVRKTTQRLYQLNLVLGNLERLTFVWLSPCISRKNVVGRFSLSKLAILLTRWVRVCITWYSLTSLWETDRWDSLKQLWSFRSFHPDWGSFWATSRFLLLKKWMVGAYSVIHRSWISLLLDIRRMSLV